LKAAPAKKGRKKDDSEEKVDVFSVCDQVETGRPNAHLHATYGNAVVDDLVGLDKEFSREDVSFLNLKF
jgi:predicted DNA-binding protein with PD1-like motif